MTIDPTGWQHTGFQQHVSREEADRKDIPEYDPRSGNHLWTAMVIYAVNPEAEMPILDKENLLGFPMIGCYYCEQPYERRLLKRRCPGPGVIA